MVGYGKDKLEGSPLSNPLGSEGGSDIGSFNEMSDGNGYGNLEGCILGELSFDPESRTEVGSYVGSSYGKVGSYVGRSLGNVYGKLEGFPLGEKLYVSECRNEVGSYVVILYRKVVSYLVISVGNMYGKLEGVPLV